MTVLYQAPRPSLSLVTASQTLEPVVRVETDVAIYAGVLHNERMCLCGMLAADYATLPDPMKDGVTRFFEANEQWLASLLEQGRVTNVLHFAGSALEMARLLVGALEGAMLVARSFGDVSRFQAIADRLLADLSVGDPQAAA